MRRKLPSRSPSITRIWPMARRTDLGGVWAVEWRAIMVAKVAIETRARKRLSDERIRRMLRLDEAISSSMPGAEKDSWLRIRSRTTLGMRRECAGQRVQ